jgi:hypothetical protein
MVAVMLWMGSEAMNIGEWIAPYYLAAVVIVVATVFMMILAMWNHALLRVLVFVGMVLFLGVGLALGAPWIWYMIAALHFSVTW